MRTTTKKQPRMVTFTAEEIANFTRFIESAQAHMMNATSFMQVVRESINRRAIIHPPVKKRKAKRER